MPVPTSPYALSSDVATLFRSTLKHANDFSNTTFPKKSDVDVAIIAVCSRIDMTFIQTGYIVPFVELTETGLAWPDFQTEYLKMLTIIGVKSYLTSHYLSTPLNEDKRKAETLFGYTFENELKTISNGGIFLSQYRDNTIAAFSMEDPVSPITSLMYTDSTYTDPSMLEGFIASTNKLYALQRVVEGKHIVIPNLNIG